MIDLLVIFLMILFIVALFAPICYIEQKKRQKEKLIDDEILNTFKWIKIPKYEDNKILSWKERYEKLNEHHIIETTFLINKVRELVKIKNKYGI